MSTRTISSYFQGASGKPPAGARVDIELAGPVLKEGVSVLAVASIALTVSGGDINPDTGYWEASVVDSETTGQAIRVRESVNGAGVRVNAYEIPAGSSPLDLRTLTPVAAANAYSYLLTNQSHRQDRRSPYYGHPELQAQIDAIAAGATDPGSEVAQARVDEEGETLPSLKARIDQGPKDLISGTGAVWRALADKVNDVHLNVKDFGAVGDGKTSTGSISAGSATLNVPGAGFTSADVGKVVLVVGAGASGANLLSTIAAYVSSTQVTLANAASTTVGSGSVAYGTDDTQALQAAINHHVDVNRGGILFLPAGIYCITSALVAMDSSSDSAPTIFKGEGWTSRIKNLNVAGDDALRIGSESFYNDDNKGNVYWTIRDLSIEGQKNSGNGLYLPYARGVRVEDVRILENGKHGIRATRAWANYYNRVRCHRNGIFAAMPSDYAQIWLEGDANAVVISNCQILGGIAKSTTAPIGIRISGSDSPTITGCDIEGNSYGVLIDNTDLIKGTNGASLVQGVNNPTIVDNHFETNYVALELRNKAGGSNVYGVTVQANHFYDEDVIIGTDVSGTNIHGGSVTSNYVKGIDTFGGDFLADLPVVDTSVTITNATFAGKTRAKITPSTYVPTADLVGSYVRVDGAYWTGSSYSYFYDVITHVDSGNIYTDSTTSFQSPTTSLTGKSMRAKPVLTIGDSSASTPTANYGTFNPAGGYGLAAGDTLFLRQTSRSDIVVRVSSIDAATGRVTFDRHVASGRGVSYTPFKPYGKVKLLNSATLVRNILVDGNSLAGFACVDYGSHGLPGAGKPAASRMPLYDNWPSLPYSADDPKGEIGEIRYGRNAAFLRTPFGWAFIPMDYLGGLTAYGDTSMPKLSNRQDISGGLGSITGTFEKGSIIWNSAPAASGYVGAVCVVAGTWGLTTAVTATANGTTALTLSAPEPKLQAGQYVTINGVATKIVSVSGVALVVANNVTAGSGLAIAQTNGTFKRFGAIEP